MPTSFSTNLALALPATGELSGTWGTTVNSNITNMLDEALGYQAFSATGGSDTLTIPDGTTGVARSIYIQLNGTGGGTVNVPTTKTKMYFVFNNTASAITFKVTGQTGVSIPAAAKIALVSNGTDIIVAENYFAALTLGAALPVASGGTALTAGTSGGVLAYTASGTLASSGALTQYGVVIGGGAGAVPTSTAAGTTTTVLHGNASGTPTFGAVSLTADVSGTLPIANGGTGTTSTTFTNLTTNVTGILPVANGGTATATPGLVQGSNITITGTWPNQTIAAAAPGTGTVTAVSVVSANGFAGTSSGGATPALTLSTSITGVLKGNGTAISAATAGTDYVTPTGTETLTNKTIAFASNTLTNVAGTSTAQTFTGGQRGAVTALTSSSASIAIDLATNCNFSYTTVENSTLAAPSNPVAGQSGVIVITQGATPRLLAYNAFYKFAGGTVPTLTATASAVDTFAYYVESATRATCQLIKDVK